LKVSVKTNFNLRLWRGNIDYKKSVSALKKMGGGVMLELSHDIHYLVWLLGNPTWVSCYYSKISNLRIDTEDCAIINIGFKKIISNIQLDFINNYNQRNMEIVTEKNYYQWNCLSNGIKKFDQKSKKLKLIFSSTFEKNYTYENQLKYFFKENNLEKIYKNFKTAVMTSLLIEAAKKSKKNNMKKEFLQI
jgi:predicted dehydrogenase